MGRSIFSVFLLIALGTSAYCASVKTIEKRQICSNGGCNNNGCDGRSCNSCNNNVCCSSVACNSCVNQCANDCSTVSCKNNCVAGCNQSCKTSACDSCVNQCDNDCSTSSCKNNCVAGCNQSCQSATPSCSTQSCSQCVNKCSNQCSNQQSNQQSNQCVNDCSSKCSECKQEKDNVLIVPAQEPSQIIVNNTNNNVVNLTTHINLNNVVHNYNNISIPVYVNTTNINNINLSETNTGGEHGSFSGNHTNTVHIQEVVPVPYPYPYTIPQQNENNCCYVLHPRQCYTDENGDRRCSIRRSRECSSGCTSPVVTIEEENDIDITEGGIAGRGCQYVRSWPYAYCGNYVRGDCDQCYTCGGRYNPSDCFGQGGCSDTCRRSAPNCVPSQRGLQCY